jgi:predicted XRE-type DNA-binding protein
MHYKKAEVLKLLDAETITALLKIYNLKYENIAIRLHITRQAIVYKMRKDRWKDFEKEIVLDLLQQHGLEITELILINKMVTTSRKVKK